MPRHLIVTCGTSQTEIDKLLQIKEWGSEERKTVEYINTDVKRQSPMDGISDSLFDQVAGRGRYAKEPPEIGRHAAALADALAQHWTILPERIGNDRNPFGGEISTLYKMAKTQPPSFDPHADTLVLLYSDTLEGAFCAGALDRLLRDERTWGIPLERIAAKRIAELREEPRDAELASENTRQALVDNRKEGNGIQNVFVITGGFKSILPLITLHALVYGDALYYLFERSKELLKVDLPADVQTPSGAIWTTRREQQQRTVKVTIETSKQVPVKIDVPPPRA